MFINYKCSQKGHKCCECSAGVKITTNIRHGVQCENTLNVVNISHSTHINKNSVDQY